MQNLSYSAGCFLKQILQRDTLKYVVLESSVQAENLAFAGEPIDWEVSYLMFERDGYWFHSRAIANSTKTVGEMLLKLRVVT